MQTAKAKLAICTTVAVCASRTAGVTISKRGILSERLSGGTIATVFGATGFLGRYVTNRFGRMGAQVVIPFRGAEKSVDHLKVMGDVGQIVPLKFDIRDPDVVRQAVSKSNTVVNCLGKHWESRHFTMEEANVDSARMIATACKEAGIKKFVHISCVGAAEDHPSEFMRTKWESEQVVRSILPEATIIRTTQMVGDDDRLLNQFGHIARVFRGYFPLPYRPEAFIQPVSVREVATAVMEVFKNKHFQGKTYELGGPVIYELRDFIEDVIFETCKIDHGRVVQIPAGFSRLFTSLAERSRQPVYGRDEVDWYERDNIVYGGMPGWADLELPAPQNIEKTAINVLRMYRTAAKFHAL
eukprot:TRINITY_DN2501_c0_g1_i1.p1 TRINITY_DN2501_c0_g1~~TRINITY_DN2501_c0_g1_i1.p1  ORF type:complete len:355 (-),score=91.34 TRINITY_DN2501_c0_g1_i1:153-1217(-)